MIVLLVVVTVGPIGLLIGASAGYLGGWVDAMLMRITDIFLAFPRLVLALAFVAALGPGLEQRDHRHCADRLAALCAGGPRRDADHAPARLHRRRPAAGRLARRIVLRHVVPLCVPSVIVRATLDMAGIILTAAGLGFLGLGAQPPMPEWGAMIAAGREHIFDQWWVAAFPGIAISSSASASTCSATACATSWIQAMSDPATALLERRQICASTSNPDRPSMPCAACRSRSAGSSSASSANPAPANR